MLVLTTFDDDQLLSGALRAGAAGFILKDSPAEDLIRAVRTVASGGAWLDPSVTDRVLSTYRSVRPVSTRADSRLAELTAREYEVLELIGRGRVNAEIARELGISEVTVKSHVGHIFGKLDLRDRSAAIVFAFDHGVVSPENPLLDGSPAIRVTTGCGGCTGWTDLDGGSVVGSGRTSCARCWAKAAWARSTRPTTP